VMLVDGELYPLHLAIATDWKVHYFSAQMAASAVYRDREARFLADPQRALGERAWAALQRVAQSLFLKYAGIDFAIDANGRVVVFETNATMAVRYPPQEPIWDYRRPAVDAVLGAVREMLVRYSSI
jgi:glutathione synthase/RimK-type ligase-like ATP-grasp enzyme